MTAVALSERIARAADFALAAEQLAEALVASSTDPADAVRLLMPLTSFVPSPLPGAGPLWANAQAIQDALASTMRCAACAALAKASAAYQPVSYQDAQSLRIMVVGAIDAEAVRVADAGRDASYQALRDLGTAVALDLAVRGATLAALVEVDTYTSVPSLAEAWTLYQDTSREPELVASANPHHPLFMPLSFQALAR
jgi:prophage DNA circulation protein